MTLKLHCRAELDLLHPGDILPACVCEGFLTENERPTLDVLVCFLLLSINMWYDQKERKKEKSSLWSKVFILIL